ncbi:hypothetical protein TNCT_671161 [Trichonephila clavata]|uniref:Uncharacterized protein n=1 Tax=Trichonephila clavata TaxID=2740835 RepID=A0A8X6L619_TRICU|nr:hypothetical protein TNCT_671161 [Trichonephila clavata]
MEMVLKDIKQHRRFFIHICISFNEEFQLNCADKINKLKPIEERAVLKTACEKKFQLLLLSENAPDAEIEKELDEKMQQIAVPKDEISRVEQNTEIISEVDQGLSKLLTPDGVPPTANTPCISACKINIVDVCKDPIEILIGLDPGSWKTHDSWSSRDILLSHSL